MHPFFYLSIIVMCIAFSAFFSGSETALFRLRKEDIDKDLKSSTKGPGVVAARDLLRSTSRLLVTILLGNTIINILAATCASAVAVYYLGENTGIIVATITMTVVIFLFGEVIPKALAAKNPRNISYMVALPLYLIHQLLRPVHILFDKVIEPFVNKITPSGQDAMSMNDRILVLARQANIFKPDGTPLPIIASAAKASETVVSDIMIPPSDFLSFSINLPREEMFNRLIASKYSRVPIYDESIDNILGVIHIKDLVQILHNPEPLSVRDIIKPVLRVPERRHILDLLKDMQSTFIHMAIVKDEFEKTEGLVTQEDILEEIVGEIRDEFDKDELLTIQKRSNDNYDAFGMVKVTDFNRETGFDIEAERGDTLSGLVYNKLGRTPHLDDVVHVSKYKITVTQVSRSRIVRVQIQKLPKMEKE